MSGASFGLKMNQSNNYKLFGPTCHEGETVKLDCKFVFKKRFTWNAEQTFYCYIFINNILV